MRTFPVPGAAVLSLAEASLSLYVRCLFVGRGEPSSVTHRCGTGSSATVPAAAAFAIVLASWMGLEQASNLLADIAAVYVVAVSGVTAAYFGFTNMGANK